MAVSKPLYLGPRLRRLRRELGLTQQAMSEDLAISPSYIALLERNQRPVTADMLLRLARAYKLDVTDLATEDSEGYAKRIGDVLRDPLFADIELPPLEVSDFATSFPGISEALLRLHGAFVREQQALTAPRGVSEEAAARESVEQVRAFLGLHANHFPTIETVTEQLSVEIADAGGLREWLGEQGVRVRFLPSDVMVESIRRLDRHNDQLLLDETLDTESRAFQIAIQIAYMKLRAEIGELVRAGGFADKSASNLARRALAGYAAAALLMPYERFIRVAEARGGDIEALARHFGVSFEQVAHRLTTLARPGREGVRFFFVRLDEAGNVSKRFDGAGFPALMQGGGCPLWTVHSTFRRPGEILVQWLELADGRRFLSIARTVESSAGQFGRTPVRRAIALVCAAGDAKTLVYASGVDPRTVAATPAGVSCRTCQRASCTARAAPPIGRELAADDTRRPLEPFAFAED